jgi:hypothetical protein
MVLAKRWLKWPSDQEAIAADMAVSTFGIEKMKFLNVQYLIVAIGT